MNQRAMKRLSVSRSGVQGEAKTTKLDAIDEIIYDQLKELISIECANMWLKTKHPNK